MKKFILCIISGISFFSSSLLANEQVFKIKNKLAQIDIDAKVHEYISILESLTNDTKNDGVIFEYNGTKVSGGNFCIKDAKIHIKSRVFEKYQRYAYITQVKTIWAEAEREYAKLYNFNQWRITGLFPGYSSTNPRLTFRVELLDVNNRQISMKQNFSFGVGGIQTYRHFFDYINKTNSEGKSFTDLLVYGSHDICFTLPIREIQQIDVIKFSVIDQYREK